MITIPPAAISLIKLFEGYEPSLYEDAVGIPTIGYGHVIRKGESFTYLNEEQATELLRNDAAWAAEALYRLVYVPLTDNQIAALISLIFNIGSGNFQSSAIRMRLNRMDYDGAASIFWQWRRAGGEILNGLVRRRAAETELFLER